MNKDEKILNEMYRRSYKASTPSADWDELLANAEVVSEGVSEGVKSIDFMSYECEMEVLQQIFNDVLKENKVPKRRHRQFEMAFWLGCGPKTKITKDE